MIISHILKHNENRRQSECMKLKVPSWVQSIRWYARYFLELDSRWYQTLLFPSRPLQNCWPPSSQCEPSQPRIVLILTISITSSMWSCRLVAVNYPNSVSSCFLLDWMCRSMKIRSEILQQLQNISLILWWWWWWSYDTGAKRVLNDRGCSDCWYGPLSSG